MFYWEKNPLSYSGSIKSSVIVANLINVLRMPIIEIDNKEREKKRERIKKAHRIKDNEPTLHSTGVMCGLSALLENHENIKINTQNYLQKWKALKSVKYAFSVYS